MKSILLLGYFLFVGTILWLCRRRDEVDEEAGVELDNNNDCDCPNHLGTRSAISEDEKGQG